MPFLRDVEVNARLLVALPLLVAAEIVVHERMRAIVRQFVDRRLISGDARPPFDRAIASAFRLRNSVAAEVVILVLVYGTCVLFLWRQNVVFDRATWYGVPGAGTLALSLAGRWYAFVSLPIYRFLLVRWYYRIFIWARFLRQTSRIPLALVPTHPDRVGGLGFLANIVYAFTPLAVAHGAMLAGPIANRIFYSGAALMDFKPEIAIMLLFLMTLIFGPFLAFAPQLARAKRTGLREYGLLAEQYVRAFDSKWLRGGAPPDEPLLGSADIQSLADLGNSFEIVKQMRFAPVNVDALFRLAGATLAPVVPLVLTMMSLEELLKRLFGMIL